MSSFLFVLVLYVCKPIWYALQTSIIRSHFFVLQRLQAQHRFTQAGQAPPHTPPPPPFCGSPKLQSEDWGIAHYFLSLRSEYSLCGFGVSGPGQTTWLETKLDILYLLFLQIFFYNKLILFGIRSHSGSVQTSMMHSPSTWVQSPAPEY